MSNQPQTIRTAIVAPAFNIVIEGADKTIYFRHKTTGEIFSSQVVAPTATELTLTSAVGQRYVYPLNVLNLAFDAISAEDAAAATQVTEEQAQQQRVEKLRTNTAAALAYADRLKAQLDDLVDPASEAALEEGYDRANSLVGDLLESILAAGGHVDKEELDSIIPDDDQYGDLWEAVHVLLDEQDDTSDDDDDDDSNSDDDDDDDDDDSNSDDDDTDGNKCPCAFCSRN